MASISTSLAELLMYIAPGLVVVFTLRKEFHLANQMVDQLLANPSQSAWLLAPLVFFALASGVIVSGIASVLFPIALRVFNLSGKNWRSFDNKPKFVRAVRCLFSNAEKQPVSLNEMNLRNVFTLPGENLRGLTTYAQTYQAYANMTIALLISILTFIAHGFANVDQRPAIIAPLSIVSIMFVFLGVAALRALRIIYSTYKQLSELPNPAPPAPAASTPGSPLRSTPPPVHFRPAE